MSAFASRRGISNSGPAHSQSRSHDPSVSFVFDGKVIGLDPDAGILHLHVVHARGRAKRFLGQDLMISLQRAHCHFPDADGDGKCNAYDLYVDDCLEIRARMPRSTQQIDGPLAAHSIKLLEPSPHKEQVAAVGFFNRQPVGTLA